MNRLIAPDSLIPTDGRSKVTGSERGAVAKAKAAYDYLFTNMRYDKTGSGWGRGDALWACDAKRGNCTDFHSPFIGMLRADGIPARFDIGFPLPETKDKGDIAGYHCWAEFYARKIGWIPVDISEAWKAKQKEDYFLHFSNEFIDINQLALQNSLLEHQVDAANNVGRAGYIFDEPRCGFACLCHVRVIAPKPSQAGFSVCHCCRDRLLDFVRQRGG